MKKLKVSIALLILSLSLAAQEWKLADVKNIGLFPQQNELRNAINISGIWKFKKDALNLGEKEQCFYCSTRQLE
jgi:beta-glucuronidase